MEKPKINKLENVYIKLLPDFSSLHKRILEILNDEETKPFDKKLQIVKTAKQYEKVACLKHNPTFHYRPFNSIRRQLMKK